MLAASMCGTDSAAEDYPGLPVRCREIQRAPRCWVTDTTREATAPRVPAVRAERGCAALLLEPLTARQGKPADASTLSGTTRAHHHYYCCYHGPFSLVCLVLFSWSLSNDVHKVILFETVLLFW